MAHKIRIGSVIIVNFVIVILFCQSRSVFHTSIGGDGLGLLINLIVILPSLFVLSICRYFLRHPPFLKYWWIDLIHMIVLIMLAFCTASASSSTGKVLAMIAALMAVFDMIYSIVFIVRQNTSSR